MEEKIETLSNGEVKIHKKCDQCGWCCSWILFHYPNTDRHKEYLLARGFKIEQNGENLDAYLQSTCQHLRRKSNKTYCDIYKTRPSACREATCPKEEKK